MENVVMPKLGLTMEEGTISKWFVSVGDKVSVGDQLCEFETDKLVKTVESKVDGIVREIIVPEDETVEVFTVLATIERS